jgi:peptide/nickel transport system permease protein
MKLRFNLIFGGFVCIIILTAAVFAPLLAHYHPVLDADLMNAELPPDAQFWFGTDAQGRDVYSRILYGAQVSLTVGIVSQCINTVIGLGFGISAIPSLIFALAIMAVLGPGLPSLLLALGLTNWSWTCRIARSSTLSLKKQGYVQAAKMLGYSDIRIMITQIVPNMIGPILVIGTLGMGDAILAEAALSYLGLGISPPDPSWGNMLTDARELIVNAPWAAIFPGVAIFLTVLGLNLFGDGLRDWLDPHMRTRKV